MTKPRPYRSRRIPACTRCRTRRIKCTVDTLGQACQQCQLNNTICSSASRRTQPTEPRNSGQVAEILIANTRQPNNGTQIMPPVVAHDTKILEEILPRFDNDSANPSATTATVFHVSIPPRRPSPASCSCLHNPSAEFQHQIRPVLPSMIDFYLTNLHPCLPMFNQNSLRDQLTSNTTYPRTLLTNFAAHVLFYWRLSHRSPSPSTNSSTQILPTQDTAWQIASNALNADIQTTGIPAIQAAILSIAGRPSKGVVHNMTNVSRIAVLSHSIGLNHDCQHWKNLDEPEKTTRWKLWWVVLIHDRWFHFAQGTPPLINASHYDVPLPTMELLLKDEDATRTGQGEEMGRDNDDSRTESNNSFSSRTKRTETTNDTTPKTAAAECYISLCQLTEIVAEILPQIYHVRSRTTSHHQSQHQQHRSHSQQHSQQQSQSQSHSHAHQRTQSTHDLNQWLSALPSSLRDPLTNPNSNRPNIPGLVNLQLSYLATKMLLKRLLWYYDDDNGDRDGAGYGYGYGVEGDEGEEKLSECVMAAGEVVRFATSLTERELKGFWLPYNTQHFTSAMTLLLRCALQTRVEVTRKQCMEMACELVDALQRYQDSFGWDLAEIALPTSGKLLDRVQAALPMLSAIQARQKPDTTSDDSSHHEVSHSSMDRSYDLDGTDLTLTDPYEASLARLFPDVFASLVDYPLFE